LAFDYKFKLFSANKIVNLFFSDEIIEISGFSLSSQEESVVAKSHCKFDLTF